MNFRASALKGFAGWLVREGKALRNPLLALARLNEQTDRIRVRRPLSTQEVRAILAAARRGKIWRKLCGEDRVMLYRVALLTGLRAHELSSLTASSFEFEAPIPTFRISATISKRRREDRLPLHPRLSGKLRRWIAGRAPGPLWPGSWYTKAARMLRVDLDAAGVKYVDARGRCADFHALRHTFGTNLMLAGVHPRHAQVLMRHSSVELTLSIYSHAELTDTAAALGKLDALE